MRWSSLAGAVRSGGSGAIPLLFFLVMLGLVETAAGVVLFHGAVQRLGGPYLYGPIAVFMVTSALLLLIFLRWRQKTY